jgi:UrcA family protein
MKMKTSLIVCMAVSIGLVSANAAFADQHRQTQTVNVMFPDLNPAKKKDAEVLFIRLQDAARDVCGDTFDTPYLTERVDIRRCEQAAVGNAVAKIDEPKLTALYDQRYGARQG